MTETKLSRLSIMDVFLTTALLEKLCTIVNRVLHKQYEKCASRAEIKGVIILHVLAPSYGSSVACIMEPQNRTFFFQMGISGELYARVWSALSCTAERRHRVHVSGNLWTNKHTRRNSLISEMEQETDAVNRGILYIPEVTVFSLDDDHQVLRSRAVSQFTNLSHLNNPQKALEPVNNAMCSARNPVFLVSQYSRPREKVIHIWQRLVQLIQGFL